jgi:hypothetical protein
VVQADTESVTVNQLAKIVDERHTRRVSLQTCSVLNSSRTWSSAEVPTADDSDTTSTCTLVNSSAALASRQYALWL